MKNDQTKTTGSRTDPLPGIFFVIVIWVIRHSFGDSGFGIFQQGLGIPKSE